MSKLQELYGEKPFQCSHFKEVGGNTILSKVWEAEKEDFYFMMKKLDAPEETTSIFLCKECMKETLGYKKREQERIKMAEMLRQEADDERIEKFREHLDGNEPLYICPDCDQLIIESDTVPIRECPHCEENFDGTDGRNCPSCNRPFTRRVADIGCPDCFIECELYVMTDEDKKAVADADEKEKEEGR